MNRTLINILENSITPFYKPSMDGLAVKHLERVVDYLDVIIKMGVKTLKDIEFSYLGYRFLTPKEDFLNNIKSSYNKDIDVSENYLFKVAFIFKYEDMEIEKVVALPFVTRGGILKLSDAVYSIVPVLSEYPIAPASNKIFLRLLRDKINFERMKVPIKIDGKRESKNVVYAKTYKLRTKDTFTKIPVVLYLLIKYGFNGLFKKFFNTEPIVIIGKNLNTEHLKDRYIEYTTIGKKPRSLKTKNNYIPHEVRILVERDKVTPFLEVVVSSIIFSFDLYPDYANGVKKIIGVKKEPSTDMSEMDSETLYWLTLLGKIIFYNKFTLDKIQNDIIEHIVILNEYLDSVIKDKLKEINIEVEDFFDLIAYIIENYDKMIMSYEEHSSNIENRYVDILYYILYDFIVAINKTFLEIIRAKELNKLSKREIQKILNRFITTKMIFNLIKNGVNLALMPVDYTGDNLYFKITSILEDQNRGIGVKRNKENVLPPNTKILRPEDLVIGSVFHLMKKYPSPRFRLNPFTRIDIRTGRFILDDRDKKFMVELDKLLSGKLIDNELLEELENKNIENGEDME